MAATYDSIQIEKLKKVRQHFENDVVAILLNFITYESGAMNRPKSSHASAR